MYSLVSDEEVKLIHSKLEWSKIEGASMYCFNINEVFKLEGDSQIVKSSKAQVLEDLSEDGFEQYLIKASLLDFEYSDTVEGVTVESLEEAKLIAAKILYSMYQKARGIAQCFEQESEWEIDKDGVLVHKPTVLHVTRKTLEGSRVA